MRPGKTMSAQLRYLAQINSIGVGKPIHGIGRRLGQSSHQLFPLGFFRRRSRIGKCSPRRPYCIVVELVVDPAAAAAVRKR